MKKISFLLASLFLTFTAFADAKEPQKDDSKLVAGVENLGPVSDGYPADTSFGPDRDILNSRVLRDFVESRGLISCRQKCGTLIIAGDMRSRWVVTGEKVNGLKARGTGTKTALNRFSSDLSLFLDYKAADSWASGKIRWSFFDGKDGGSATRVEIDRLFLGYDVYKCGSRDFYVEVGRSALYFLFESKVQFGSCFDGIHLYYTDKINAGKFVAHGGPFIVDPFTNHYGAAFETYLKNIYKTPFLVKYSLINWHREAPTLDYGNNAPPIPKSPGIGKTTIEDNPRYQFMVSQILGGYEKSINFCGCKILYAYGAFLKNHLAKGSFATDDKKLSTAWYTGITLGKVCQAGDFSFDLNYQYVKAQAIPEFDLAGIGHGNAPTGSLTKGPLLSDSIIGNLFNPGAYPASKARGFCNYRGVECSLIYAISDALTIKGKAQWTIPITTTVGGDFTFKNFEMAAIYAF